MFVCASLIVCLLAGVWAKSDHEVHRFGKSDEALFLTPYIENGQLDLAKSLAKVGTLKGDNIPSYSGYLTVNKTTESNLFFWFFPALKNAEKAPTLLWLQGGPGSSSLLGLFLEHGPYSIIADGSTRFRNATWAQQFNMIYIDSPVGTGFSFTKSDAGYVNTQPEVGRDLFEALQQFFTLFSEYANNDFYVTGESYAGKYVPAIAYTIHQNKDKAKMKLKGIAIGDGLCDPITMLDFADFLEQIGLLDHAQATYMRGEQDKAVNFIRQGEYEKSFHIFNELVLGAQIQNGTKVVPWMDRVTGLKFHYNFLLAKQPADFDYYQSFVLTPQTRKALHVGEMTFNDGMVVKQHLVGDFMRTVKPWVAELMNNYKVMIYSGQLDIIVANPLTANFVESIPWDGANDLSGTERIIWRNLKTGDPAGYVRQARNFTQVLVRNAGHILPYDQPDNAYDMIDRFVNDKPFN